MKIAAIICRTLLGLGFVVFGLNILHSFMPQPPMPEGSPAAVFMSLMVPTHWMDVIGAIQLIGGLLVLFGRTAPLGLVMLGPILVNILCFHILVLGGQGVEGGLVFSILEIFLIYAYRKYFRSIFTIKANLD